MRTTHLSFALLLVACTATTPPFTIDTGVNGDGGVVCPHVDPRAQSYVEQATPAPGGGWCCPSGSPTCECEPLGGWAEERCGCAPHAYGICDLAPSEWIRVEDHGCHFYRVADRPVASCVALPCDSPGHVGAACRLDACDRGTCEAERTVGVFADLGLLPGQLDVDHPGHFVPSDPPADGADVVLTLFSGSMCAAGCDPMAPDTCGACASCSAQHGQSPLINAARLAPDDPLRALVRELVLGEPTEGLCRLDCEYDARSRGDCPTGTTCDRVEQVCVEACSSDAECSVVPALTHDGGVVTTTDASTCDATTGRCTREGNAAARVGSPCETDHDCAPVIGVCALGSCAELGCTGPAAPCSDGAGICLPVTERTSACVAACASAEDCAPGLACHPVPGAPAAPGYCVDTCTDSSTCRTSETCTATTRGDGTVEPGECARRCDAVDARGSAAGCADDEYCRGASTGAYCAPLGAFCDVDADCGGGQRCDELLARTTILGREVFGDGHCVDACTDTSCLAPLACVTSGTLTALCREPCTASTTCAAGTTCDATLGFCVEMPRADAP